MEYRVDRDDMLKRFLTYVKVWTASDESCEATPSSERQRDLAKLLVPELEALGLVDVRLDDHCYVYGRLPERFAAGSPRAGKAPALSISAISFASCTEKLPDICARPEGIFSLITGAV